MTTRRYERQNVVIAEVSYPVSVKLIRCWQFIERYQILYGVAPSIREIAAHMGSSISMAQQQLDRLEGIGAIRRWHYFHRGIELKYPAPALVAPETGT